MISSCPCASGRHHECHGCPCQHKVPKPESKDEEITQEAGSD